MSTLQAQADELRGLAGDGSMEWVAGPIRASVLREAANTILSLRDRAQELQAENAKLREELEAVGTAAYLYGRDDLKTENAKLRELLAAVGHLLFILDVDYCGACLRDGINHPCPVYTSSGGECLYKTDMRELGIEVG